MPGSPSTGAHSAQQLTKVDNLPGYVEKAERQGYSGCSLKEPKNVLSDEC